jgi:ABC-type multidrug transport system fused ATPase/permease subunit
MKEKNYAFKSLKLLITKYPLIILGQVFETLANIISTIIPIYIISEIVSAFENNKEFSDVLTNILIYLGLLLISALISLIIGFTTNYIDRNFKVFVATSLFKKLDSIDYDFHENNKFLNNYTRALEQGPDRIYNTAIHQLALIRVIFQSLSVFAIIFQMHPLTVVYAIIIGIIYIIIKRQVAKINYRLISEQQPLSRRRNYYNRVFYLKDAMADLKTTNVEGLLLNRHETIGSGLVDRWGRLAALTW